MFRQWLNESSKLLLRYLDPKPIELGANLDLTGQAARVAHVEGEIEHVLFHLAARARLLAPFGLDIDMAGRAGAGAAAVGVDAGHHVLDRGLHHRQAGLALDGLLRTRVLDEGDLHHAPKMTQ